MHEITDIKDNMILDPRCYLRSLLEKCAVEGVMTENEINKIMEGLLLILSDKINEFNRGESSSVTVEKAEEIMMSIMFVISLKLKSFNSPKAAISALKENSPKSLYEGGIELGRRKIAVCRHLQKRIADNLFDTPNIFYRSTIIDGINILSTKPHNQYGCGVFFFLCATNLPQITLCYTLCRAFETVLATLTLTSLYI